MAIFKSKKKTAEPVAEPTLPTTKPESDDDQAVETPLRPVSTTASEVVDYPEGLKLGLILLSVFVTMFLVSLVCAAPCLSSVARIDPTSSASLLRPAP